MALREVCFWILLLVVKCLVCEFDRRENEAAMILLKITVVIMVLIDTG